jgi:hypothetical protein
MARLLNVVVEASLKEGETKNIRKAIQRINDALLNLVQNPKNKSYYLGNHKVAAIHCDGIWGELDKPCIVPDFGHNHACKCENTEVHGVLRLFGVNSFVIDGEPDHDEIFGTWEIANGIRVVVCGISGGNMDGERVELKRIER